MKDKRVLITGGAGFIGSNLASELHSDNEVIVLDDLSNGDLRNLQGLKVRFIKASVTDKELTNSLPKLDFIFHLAAVSSIQLSVAEPERCFKVNMQGSHNIIMAALKHRAKLIFASSAAVYGDSQKLPLTEQTTARPLTPYAASKLAVEHFCEAYSLTHKLNYICLRLFNVYGPKQNPNNDYSGVISKFIANALANRNLVIYGDGSQTRDFVFVKDVVNAMLSAAESKINGIFNIGSGISFSILNLAKMVIKLCNSNSQIRFEEAQKGDIKHSLAMITRASKHLGYKPSVKLEQGLKQTIAYLMKNEIQKA